MAKTTDELFAEATEADYETAEPVTLAASDTEEEFQFRIDEHLRTIAIPEKGVVAGVEGDLNVNIARFTMTRYYHGRDLSKLNIRINYRNANGQVNYYTVSDATISGDSIVFSWEYAADVTQYKGNVQFVVYLFSATSAVLKQKFFTTLGTLEVLEGLEVDSSIPVSEQTDILLHLKKDLSAYAEEVKKSLPADYTAMTEQVSSLKEELNKLNDGGLNLKDEVIDEDVNNWLNEHPEATTTVQDGSIAEKHLTSELAKKIDSGKGNIIDLEKYGIVQADFIAPFTSENYKIAYNNGLGIQKAIDDAKSAGSKNITLPAGNYPICYSSDSDTTYNAIIDAQGIDFIGYGAKLYIIYDEDGVNPYFTGETPRLLQGTVIKTDSNVRGFHLVGERAFRTSENTKYREFSSGIGLTETTNGNLIKDCIVELFSGDGIGCKNAMEQIAGWTSDTDGLFTSVDWDEKSNTWIENKTKFTSVFHGGDWIDKTRPILLRSTGYFLYTSAPLRILCFDENDTYIGDVRFWQGEYFYFLPNTSKWYLQMVREVEHETTATEVWGYWIGYGYYNDTTIDNCEVRFNQRGGISNVPSGSTIKNCIIHHNGCAYENMVAFYDSTQFGIDIEDVFIHDVSIEGCHIFNNLQGVLYRCWGIRFKNCSIYGYVNSLNSCVDFYAENTRFNWSCTMNSPTPFGTKVAIGCIFNGTKAKEILDVASGIVTSTKVNNDGIVNFLNANGEVVFNMDLTTLIYIAPELVVDGLEIGCDFTTLETGTTSFDLQYGNATATAKAGMIVDGGCVPVGNGNYVTVTDNESDYSANEFTIEMFCLGFPCHAMRSISGNFDLISADATGASLITEENYSLSTHYSIPYNGGKIGNTNVFSKVYVDGVESTANRKNIPDLNIDKYIHIVITGNANGEVFAYLNGYKSTKTGTATNSDFETWSTSDFTNFYLYGGPASETQILKHFNLYNKALSEDEIEKNLNYFKKTFGYDS